MNSTIKYNRLDSSNENSKYFIETLSDTYVQFNDFKFNDVKIVSRVWKNSNKKLCSLLETH